MFNFDWLKLNICCDEPFFGYGIKKNIAHRVDVNP